MKEKKEYGIRWMEFSRDDRIVKKEKTFRSQVAMERFIERLYDKNNFFSLESSFERTIA